MVDIVNRQISGAMPVDFASYLLSASPPGFESLHQCSTLKTSDNHYTSPNSSTDSLYAQLFAVVTTPTTPIKPTSASKKSVPSSSATKKRVSFADDLGKELISIRVMTDSSHTPPVIRSASALIAIGLSGRNDDSDVSNPILNFIQPVSNYSQFQERLRVGKVSLENVVVKGLNIAGTVTVANVGYEKSVNIRYTTNDWLTYVDVKGHYVASTSSNGKDTTDETEKFDRFSFEVGVEEFSRLRFCVRFECAGQVFWDNNNGLNYEIVSAKVNRSSSRMQRRRSSDAETIFAIDFQDSWTDFGWWQHSHNSTNLYW